MVAHSSHHILRAAGRHSLASNKIWRNNVAQCIDIQSTGAVDSGILVLVKVHPCWSCDVDMRRYVMGRGHILGMADTRQCLCTQVLHPLGTLEPCDSLALTTTEIRP